MSTFLKEEPMKTRYLLMIVFFIIFYSLINTNSDVSSLNITYAASKDSLGDSKYITEEHNKSEFIQMIVSARGYVKANSAPGITYDLKLLKHLNNFAVLKATPTGGWAKKTDDAYVILEKIGGEWVPQTMGTDFTGSKWESLMETIMRESSNR
jgi:hypothetical protein